MTGGSGSRGAEMVGGFLLCEVEGLPHDTEKEQRPLQAKPPPQKRRAVIRVESAEKQDCASAPQWIEEEMEALSFIPSAVRQPRSALHMCDIKCGEGEGAGGPKGLRGKLWAACGMEQFVPQKCGNVSPSKKRGPDQCWQMQKVKGTMEQTAGGNSSPSSQERKSESKRERERVRERERESERGREEERKRGRE